jgi:hypothetical protein
MGSNRGQAALVWGSAEAVVVWSMCQLACLADFGEFAALVNLEQRWWWQRQHVR